MKKLKPKLVIALDTNIDKAKKIVHIAKDYNFKIFKVGHILFDTHPEIIKYINKLNCNVILDLKFHDIPSVVAKTISEITKKYKIFAFTLHTLGGKEMIKETKNILNRIPSPPLIFAVTILTSLEEKDIKFFGFKTNLKNTVVNLAKIAKKSGADGVVCSIKEIKSIKQSCGKNFLTLVPGISIERKNIDQKRSGSVENVISCEGDYIVIGRSIYESENLKTTFELLKKYFV